MSKTSWCSRGPTSSSGPASRTLVLYDRGELLGKSWADDKVWVDHNFYWNTAGPVSFPGGKTLEQWRDSTGHDGHSARSRIQS